MKMWAVRNGGSSERNDSQVLEMDLTGFEGQQIGLVTEDSQSCC